MQTVVVPLADSQAVTQVAGVQPTGAQATGIESADTMVFHGCAEPTIGVELELQILDQDSGDLAPGAVPLLKACAQEGVEGVVAELMQSMIEVKTGVCGSVAEARDELLPRLKKTTNLASSLGYALAMSATHPF